MQIGNNTTEWKVYEELMSTGQTRLVIAESMSEAAKSVFPDSLELKEKTIFLSFPEEFVKEMHGLYHDFYENNEVADYGRK